MLRIAFVLLTIWALSLPASANDLSTLDKVRIQLKWMHSFQFAGYYAAKEQGFFADEGLDVTLIERSPDKIVTEEVIAGRAEYGVHDAGLVLDRVQGKPVVIVASIFQHSPIAFATLKDSGIVSPYEMSGKRVMMDRITDAALIAMFASSGIRQDQYTLIPHSFDERDLIDGKVDAISIYLTDEPYYYLQNGIAINIINPQNYGIDFPGDLLFTTETELRLHPGRAEKMRKATIRGWEYALKHPDEVSAMILSHYPSRFSPQDKGRLHYAAKEITKLILPDIVPLGKVDGKRFEKTLNDYKVQGLVPTTASINGLILPNPVLADLSLTEKQRDWLKKHPILRLGITRDFPPYEWIDEQDRYIGPIAEFIGLLEKELGIHFEIVHDRPWNDILAMAKRGELDMLSCINKTPERSKFLNFTSPYKSTHIVIIDNGQGNYIGELSQLNGKKVSVELGYFMQELLAQDHPDIQVVPADDTAKALDMVVSGAVDAYVGDAGTANYFIRKGALFSLRFSGQTEYQSQYRFATNQASTELSAILDKAISAIPKEEFDAIFDRWLGLKIEIEQGIKTEILVKVASGVLLLFFIFCYWLIRLKQEINQRKLIEHQLACNNHQFKTILDNLFTYIALLDTDGRIVEINNAPLIRGGYRRIDVIGLLFADTPWWNYDATVQDRLLDAIKLAKNGQQIRYDENVKMGQDLVSIDFQISPIISQEGLLIGILPSAVDITERKQIEAKLAISEEQHRFALEGSDLGFWDWKITTGEVERNRRWAEILGYTHEEIQHTTQQWMDFIHPDHREQAWQSIKDVLEGKAEVHKIEYPMLHKDGTIRWILDQAKVVQRDSNGSPIRMSGTHTDITERKCFELDIQHQANTDYLTGVNNRRHFMELAERELTRAKRYDSPMALFMIDIDFFKQINDTHGHAVGDRVLKELANVCLQTLRDIDIVGRLGGEEFAILLPETALDEAIEVANRLHDALANTQISNGEHITLKFTVSLGISALQSKQQDLEQLLDVADQALYEAKRQGRNRVCIGT